ncbi:hypothetical protein [Fodinicola acaciae]|uniref:hypothetical protein n=1 Tax=Fodinicola acaciae TaxID=2681555 RepID=UPI0013D09D4D|nr:hypothetical protein [Fodinicola acaciae]
MTDFEDDVRAALSTIETERPLDPVGVIKRGRKIRTRRRVLAGLAAVAVVGAAAVVPRLGATTVTTSASDDASRSYVCPAPGVARKPAPGSVPLKEIKVSNLVPAVPAGDAICTGAFDSKGEAIIFFVRTNGDPTKFTIWEGRRDAAGEYFGYFRGEDYNLTSGSADLKPGFHILLGDGFNNFVFGYYAGPAAEVEFIAQGRKMDTHVQKWSENPDVRFVWFRIPSGVDPDRIYDTIYRKPGDVKITVRDTDGNVLPLGNVTIAG